MIEKPQRLSDGTMLPHRAHVLMAVHPVQFENPDISNLKTFDGFHDIKLQQQAEQADRCQFATTDRILGGF